MPGDAHRLHQVVANLLANAHTHTPPGTEVTVRITEEPGTVTMTVTDTGPGVPEHLQPDVFDRFTRADQGRTRSSGGTGLGLAIVASVVAAHGGTTDLTSRPGHTEFRLRLPRAPDAAGPPVGRHAADVPVG